MKNYMNDAFIEAKKGVDLKDGGPFGAVVVDKMGNVIGTGHNQVLIDHDPTAHAEITAIRNACKALKTHDLKDCVLYTLCEPCPMCLSATIWANIKTVYYACDRKDAASIGFRDDLIYNYLEQLDQTILNVIPVNKEKYINEFLNYDGTIY